MIVPEQPKIYHIVHIDRLRPIVDSGCLWCDAEAIRRSALGTSVGMNKIKQRRLHELKLSSHPDLFVGQCVPFYFCPRSVMLYLLSQANHPELEYRQGQGPIVHLEVDLYRAVQWAEENHKRWAFTLSNAGSYYFEDRCDLNQLHEINWDAVFANKWSGVGIPGIIKEEKQSEFLVEGFFPWYLVERIGVLSERMVYKVIKAISGDEHKPSVEARSDWYY